MSRFPWILLVAALAVPAAAVSLGLHAWPFELAYNFVPHLAAAALLTGAAFAVVRRPALAVAAGSLALAYGANAVMVLQPPAAAAHGIQTAPSHASIRLVSFNVNANRDDTAGLLRWIAGRPADVLVLIEVMPALRDALQGLRRVYPYQVAAPPGPAAEARVRYDTSEASSILILSRFETRDVRIAYPGGRGRPALTVRMIGPGGRAFTVAAVHPVAPMSVAGLAARNRYLDRLANALAGVRGPLVVAGDFNATPFTPRFQRFLERLRLDRPHRPPATFPALAGPFGLPIDHVLVRDMALRRLDPLTGLGSDHRGLMARLALAFRPALAARAAGRSTLFSALKDHLY